MASDMQNDHGGAATGPATTRPWQKAARAILSFALLGLGLYLLSNYLRALVWAVVLAIALWPLYERARLKVPERLRGEALPILFAALVGLVFLLPFVVLVVEAARELHEIVDYSKQVEQAGLPVPAFVAHLPFASQAVGDWWTAHLAHAGWAKDAMHQVDTGSNRALGRDIGKDAIHRVVLFGFALLALFFLFRDSDAIVAQCRTASEKLFGARGERVARQMVASVHGTVNGLVLVGIGEGVLLGVVYFFTKVPHPILFGALTAVAAMVPFAAAIAFGLAALTLLGSGSAVAAVVVVVAGFIVTFTADHFVRPSLIGGTTKLPFLWVLLGILGRGRDVSTARPLPRPRDHGRLDAALARIQRGRRPAGSNARDDVRRRMERFASFGVNAMLPIVTAAFGTGTRR